MAESPVITPDPPSNQGLDYACLKEEGTKLVQKLSGAIWTDYNEHDPGVTTLEQLCYALTELSYRAEFPLASLLIDPRTGRIDVRGQALFPPRRILPSAPLTQNDYRKLIVDRVPGVDNVWLTPYHADPPRPDFDGLYDIAVYAPEADPCGCDDRDHLRPEIIRERVRRVYCGHRALCEDLHEVRLLEPLRAVVSGAAVIDNSLAAEPILARILFNLASFLAPELPRQPLSALIKSGSSASAIFNGPLLRHGFIADDELAPKAKAILLSDIVRVMVRSPGVISVRDVVLRLGDKVARGDAAASIPLPDDAVPRLETQPVEGLYPISLWRNGIEVKPDPARVDRELARLWKDYRRKYSLARQYLEYFSVPSGEYRDVKPYYSIQNQYPNVYGINSFGLPAYAKPPRRAQAKQLKGYLLVFEQLLADFFAQLANARRLYSTAEPLAPTYFFQFLDRSVPDVGPLLQEGYRDGLALIVKDSDPVVERRNRFLDVLLALYAERVDADLLPFLAEGEASGARLIRAKLALLHHLVRATRDRSAGFDYLAPTSPRNVAGMAIRCRIELGMPPQPRRPLAERLEELGLALAEEAEQETLGAVLSAHVDYIDDKFTPLEALTQEQDASAPDRELVEQAVGSLHGHRVGEGFLAALAEGEIRLGSLPGDTMIAVVCRASSAAEWRLVGKYIDRARALAILAALLALARELTGALRQLYIVEHILLRFGHAPDHDGEEESPVGDLDDPVPAQDAAAEAFRYNFTLTAVVSDAPHHRHRAGYRAGVAEVIRRNTPAHVALECRFLRPHRMAHFERLYFAWRRALRQGDRHRIRATSRRLRWFLQRAVGGDATGNAFEGRDPTA